MLFRSRERIHILAEAGPDVFACETIPCLVEALAETDVLSEIPGAEAWISFSCKDGLHTCGGDLISDCAKALKDIKEVAAIGINCTAPQYVESLIKEIVKVTDKPVVVYPNSGEDYDAGSKSWEGSAAKYQDYVKIWTSGEPVSPAWVAYCSIMAVFSSLRIIVVFPPFKIFPESKYRAGRIPASERAVSRNWEMGRSAWRYLLRIAYECRKVKRKLPGISEIFHARAPDRIRQDSIRWRGTIIPGRREVYAEGHKIRRLVAV